MMLSLYRAATVVFGPLIRWHLARRRGRGKEDPVRFRERLGFPGGPRPEGGLVWLHAASVGESLSILPLIERLLEDRPGLQVLVTTGTVTSADLLAKRLPNRARHQYVPVDRPAWVARFLDHWHPDLALWSESEFWPNLMRETAERGIPMALLNGRISDRSFSNWRRFPRSTARLLSGFRLCLGQTPGDAERLRRLGAQGIDCVGNLKYAAPPLPDSPATRDALVTAVGNRPLWLLASSHAGEEALAGRVHLELMPAHPHLLTLIAPRHPQRGNEVAAELSDLGLRVVRRSEGMLPNSQTDIYLADTIGELGLFYRMCRVVLIGKSLVGQGGQNPLEPARLGCAVLHGPHMDNFAAIRDDLAEAGGAVPVAGEAELRQAVDRLLRVPADADALGRAAQSVADGKAEVLDRVVDRLAPLLDPIAGRGDAAA